MKKELRYIELKQEHSGPAWIGFVQFSKSGQAIYFNGKVLRKGRGVISNYFDIENGEEYWVSGVKKNGLDRHWAGSGKIQIDELAVDHYLEKIGQTALPNNKFILVTLNNIPNKALANEIENSRLDR